MKTKHRGNLAAKKLDGTTTVRCTRQGWDARFTRCPRTSLVFVVAGLWIARCLLEPTPAFALDLKKSIFQFNCQNWNRQNGLPAEKINTITQTTDGYIWLGSQNGLIRFDGREFKAIPVDLPQAQGQEIRQLARAHDGALWFTVYDGGFGGYDGEHYIPFGDARWVRPHMTAIAILKASDGSIWTGGNMGIGRWVPGSPEKSFFLENTHLTFALFEDNRGRIWNGTPQHGLFCWADGKLTHFPDEYLDKRNINTISGDAAGILWVGTEAGLRCYEPDGRLRDIPDFNAEVRAIMVDRGGSVWIGTTGSGLARFQNGAFTFLRKADGLISDDVTSLFEDAEGSIWVGTPEGLSQLTDIRFPIYSGTEGLIVGSIHTVSPSNRGGIWITGTAGLCYFDGRVARDYTKDLPLANRYIKNAFEARNGNLYIEDGDKNFAVLSSGKLSIIDSHNSWPDSVAEDPQGILVGVGGNLFRLRDGALHPYAFAPELVPEFNWIYNLLVVQDGSLWVSSHFGAFHVQGERWRRWSKADGLPAEKVQLVCEDDEGTIWLGTGAGLARLKDGRVTTISFVNGLYDDRIYGFVPDQHGSFWINSGNGIFRVARKSLNDFADGRSPRVECEPFNGLESVKFSDRTDQGMSGCATPDGRVWFPSPHGVVMIDPTNYYTNKVPPPVHIQSVQVNGMDLPLQAKAPLITGNARVEVSFAALSFVAPAKVRVRYQLDGFDSEWVEAGARRLVLYNRLRPGAYTFRVQAFNMDGLSSTADVKFAFRVPPPYYETVWFRALGAVIAGLLALAIFRWKVRRMRANQRALETQNDLLEAKVLKRTDELARANAMLQGEVGQRKEAEAQLTQRTLTLETEIEERKHMQLEIERVHRMLVESSRKAGMAEVAINVLHNIGNVLNSVNVSTTLIGERLHKLEVAQVSRVSGLLRKHENDVGDFLTHNPQGRKLPAYLEELGRHLVSQRQTALQELGELHKHLDQIKEIVTMHQAYTPVAGRPEMLPVVDAVEEAIKNNANTLERHQVILVRDFRVHPTIAVDKYKMAQILVNLVANAAQACAESGQIERVVTVHINGDDELVRISVADNGVGISAENLTEIFSPTFTKRASGHGFGLHSDALAAKEMGGGLTVRSTGLGQGATFVLELPLRVSMEPSSSVSHESSLR